MKRMRSFLLTAALLFAVGVLGQGIQGAIAANAPDAQQTQRAQQPSPTVASFVDREISAVEKQVLDAAEAMPEDKFHFSPESLRIPGGEYKGVHTFAVQVK